MNRQLTRAGRWRRWARRTGWRHGIGIVAAIVALFPVVYVVGAAFSASGDTTKLIPRGLGLANFHALFGDSRYPFWTWFGNSMLICVVTAICTVFLAATAAFAFSRLRFRGRRAGLIALIVAQMFPGMLTVVALFLIMVKIKGVFPAIGLGSHAGLILIYLGGAAGGNAWLMKGFFDAVPIDLDESARVDGATHAQVFFRIILPLVTPILAVVGILAFIFSINDFVVASALLVGSHRWTLAVGLYQFVNGQYAQYWGPFAAGALITAIPVVALFLGLQRYIVAGLTQGSVKG